MASADSKREELIQKAEDDESDIPGDFEPGACKETLLLPASSYEEDEECSPSSGYPNDRYSRKGSCISEIGRCVSGGDYAGETSQDADTQSVNCGSDSETEEAKVQLERLRSDEATPDQDYEADEDMEEVNSLEWKQHKKHIFVLSEAGKPIYSRYGNEDKLVTLMGVIQALISFVQQSGDAIRSVHAGGHNFVFMLRIPLILVAVSTTNASVPQLVVQLTYIYNQILSVLTFTNLNRIFEQRHNYDLRRLLGGAEKFLDNLVDTMEIDPSFLLNAVRCLSLDSSVRDVIGQTLAQHCGKVKNVVFAILLAENQLVTLVRMKKYFLHPADLHLVMNLVSASGSFKSAETWIPICLPKFDSSGFLHGHISYIDDQNTVCLLLLTVEKDMFFPLQKCRGEIVERLKRHHCLEVISASLKSGGYSVNKVGLPDIRHFLYKSRSTAQFTFPRIEAPYASPTDYSRLFGLYQYLHHRMYNGYRPLKTLYYAGEKETMVGWHMQGFELYAAFEPLATKLDATNAMKRVVHWIKKEEDKLFIMNAPSI